MSGTTMDSHDVSKMVISLGMVLSLLPGCGSLTKKTEFDTEVVQVDTALLDAFEHAAAQARGTPAMESTFHVRNQTRYLALLRHQDRGDVEELAEARRYLEGKLAEALLGPSWPAPPTFDIPLATQPPVIDGRLDDPAWSAAATFNGIYRFNKTQRLGQPATAWKILWDLECLYFAFECADDQVLAPSRSRDEPVYEDDCVEMFILPSMAPAVYWELVVSPSGGVYDGLHAKRLEAWGPEPRPQRDIADLRVGCTIARSQGADTGYVVEVAVPFAALPEYSRQQPVEGHTLRLMLVRLDRAHDGMTPYAFIPLMSWGHNIWNYATIRLTGPVAGP